MLLLLLKSSACLAIFMVFYKLLLEQTSAHTFKRFYLIGILIISIGIPFLTFRNYIEVPLIPNSVDKVVIPDVPKSLSNTIANTTSSNYLHIILWSIYGIGLFLFAFRFINNLSKLYKKIRQCPKREFNNFNLVLLNDNLPPHTFFNYIFLNKDDFQNNKIDNTVLLHEQTHARQKHTADILIIEVIQIIFWFNPLLVILKKFIKLNHEFLADKSVLKTGIDTSIYQNTLLSFSSNNQHPKLVNPINYTSLKKRFKIMKTKTSISNFMLRILILIPVLGYSVYGFSQKETIVKNGSAISQKDTYIKHINLIIKSEDNFVLNGKAVKMETLKDEIYALNPSMTEKQMQNFVFAYIIIEKDSQLPYAKNIYSFLFKNCNIIRRQIINIKNNTQPNIFKNPFEGKTIKEAQEIIDNETIDLTPREKSDSPWKVTVGVNAADLTLNSKLNMKDYNQNDLNEYNSLVNKFNKLPEDRKVVKVNDFLRLNELYVLIPEEKRVELKPYPDFLTPPKSDKQIVIDIINNGASCYLDNKY